MADFTPLNREMKERAKAQRKTMTGMESNLWFRFLRKHQPRFRRKFVIGNYIAENPLKRCFFLFSSEARFKGVDLAPKEKVRSETGNEM